MDGLVGVAYEDDLVGVAYEDVVNMVVVVVDGHTVELYIHNMSCTYTIYVPYTCIILYMCII